MTFIEVFICHRIGTIAIDVLYDLDLHFKGKTFSCYAFVKNKIAQTADVPGGYSLIRTALHGVALVILLTLVTN